MRIPSGLQWGYDMPVYRGIWQTGTTAATQEEVAAALRELQSRNVFHSQQTFLEIERRGVEKEALESKERKQKVVSGVMWGGVGVGMVVIAIIALR